MIYKYGYIHLKLELQLRWDGRQLQLQEAT